MNAKYIRSRATASRLIKANGAKFKWRAIRHGEFDPVTETTIGETTEYQDVWAVILPPNFKGQEDRFAGENGTLDLSKIRSILISVEGIKFNPAPLHQILYRNEWWLYEDSKGLDPDGETDILFKGFIRRT